MRNRHRIPASAANGSDAVPLSQNSNRAATWSVYYRRNKKWRRKRFQEDFGAALRFYQDCPHEGKTLHCDNVAFRPPTYITEHEVIRWEVVRIKGKKYKRRIVTTHNRMMDYNRKGVWWCPYCIKLRRFKELQTARGTQMCCPVCWVSNYMFHVRQCNPQAAIIEQGKQPRRTTHARRRRRV